jgi:hypothetical protein
MRRVRGTVIGTEHETGIEIVRDLSQVAFGGHRPPREFQSEILKHLTRKQAVFAVTLDDENSGGIFHRDKPNQLTALSM